ncbi:hypothetical protein EG328_011450 [Venturia inaequalis]|uniref:Uncharacterized protein n=1 Tax=Venturia inaequalis TaxID=5025 RepID=A0A8H3YKU6_VENIN|nr:hypothetical protein EG328_011450 [Venturia inaequalis]
MAPTFIDLTSPVKRNSSCSSTTELENAIATVPEAQLRSVLTTLCHSIARKSPDHTAEILGILAPPPTPTPTINKNKKRHITAALELFNGSNKMVKVAASGGVRDLHGLVPRRWRLPPPCPEKSNGLPKKKVKICENCKEELSYEDDGCCKMSMMQYRETERYQQIVDDGESDDGGECEYGCGECGFDEEGRPDEDTWCKPRRMASARREGAKDYL